MAPHFESLIHRLKQGLSTVELVYVPHDLWPLRRLSTPTTSTPGRVRISVLDSSFNPPTLAHHALARARSSVLEDGEDFDARLLLLSVRNADKSLKQGDATYSQRLEMMVLLAQSISTTSSSSSSANEVDANVAVAIIDEPTFVGKSRILLEFMRSRVSTLSASFPIPSQASLSLSPELIFVVGLDTLERILAVRYYEDDDHMRRSLHGFLSSSGDNSRLLCARRSIPGSLKSPSEHERLVLELARKHIDIKRLEMIDIGATIEAYSSSEVRERVAHSDSLWERMVLPRVAEYIKDQQLYISTPSDTQNDIRKQ